MTRSLCKLPSKRQRGVAAVELAIVLPVLFVLMTVPIFFARYFFHYTVVHKAAQNAARYLSTVSVREMRTPALAVAAGKIANDIAAEELADIAPGQDGPTIEVFCGPNILCSGYGSGPMPETVAVGVHMYMFDNIFGVVNTGFYGWRIATTAEVRYVGR